MIFGKHINRYYLRYLHWLILGLVALVAVDYLQLVIPNLYQMVINGINQGYVLLDGAEDKTLFIKDARMKRHLYFLVSQIRSVL